MKAFPKGLIIIAVIGVVLVAAFIYYERELRPHGDGPRVSVAPPSKEYPPEKFKSVPVVEDSVTLAERLTPGRKHTRAEDILEGFKPGTEAIEVNGNVVAYRDSQGGYHAPNDGPAVVVYRKPIPPFGFEKRPFIGVGAVGDAAGIEPAGTVLVGVAHYDRFHAGAGVLLSPRSAGAVAGIGYNARDNIDLWAGGGYSTRGACAFVTVGLSVVKPGP